MKKKLKDLTNDKINLSELMALKGGTQTGRVQGCTSKACESYACSSGSCLTNTCSSIACVSNMDGTPPSTK